ARTGRPRGQRYVSSRLLSRLVVQACAPAKGCSSSRPSRAQSAHAIPPLSRSFVVTHPALAAHRPRNLAANLAGGDTEGQTFGAKSRPPPRRPKVRRSHALGGGRPSS